MSTLYILLSGNPTSKLNTTDVLYDNDLFLISHPIDTYRNDVYTTNSIAFLTIVLDIRQCILDKYSDNPLHFGSMAYESSSDWSPISHMHNYTSVVVDADYSKTSSTKLIATAYISNDISTHTVEIYHPVNRNPMQYQIGLLKFVAWPKLPIIDTDNPSDDFDGWVYPDGRMLSKTRFSDAYKVFLNTYGDETETEFRIPNIALFIKSANITSDVNRLIVPLDAVSSLKPHTHTINNAHCAQSLNVSLSVLSVAVNEADGHWTTESLSTTAHMILSAKTDLPTSQRPKSYLTRIRNVPVNLSADMTVNAVTSCEILNELNLVEETHPLYNDIPVLMYVGGVK